MSCTFNLDMCNMVFSVSCIYPSTKDYCEAFIVDKPGEHEIIVTQEDLDIERENCLEEGVGIDPSLRNCSDDRLEIVALLRKIADYITHYGRALVHGSAICVDDKAYIFTAVSGTGKSTHTKLLRKLLGDRCIMINDDKPFLMFDQDQVFVCGTPWMGKHRIGNKIIKPLAGIFFLHRSEDNTLTTLEPSKALSLMLSQIHRPVDMECMLHTLGMLDNLLANVPLYDFGCNMDISAAELSSSVMK